MKDDEWDDIYIHTRKGGIYIYIYIYLSFVTMGREPYREWLCRTGESERASHQHRDVVFVAFSSGFLHFLLMVGEPGMGLRNKIDELEEERLW